MHCELCQAREQERWRLIFENELVFVLVNQEPIKPGHVIILPVRHVSQLSELTPAESQMFLQTLDKCMAMVTVVYGEAPMCIVNGPQFRSQPLHLHAHVLPSKHAIRGLYTAAEGTEFRVRANVNELTAMTERLKQGLVLIE